MKMFCNWKKYSLFFVVGVAFMSCNLVGLNKRHEIEIELLEYKRLSRDAGDDIQWNYCLSQYNVSDHAKGLGELQAARATVIDLTDKKKRKGYFKVRLDALKSDLAKIVEARANKSSRNLIVGKISKQLSKLQEIYLNNWYLAFEKELLANNLRTYPDDLWNDRSKLMKVDFTAKIENLFTVVEKQWFDITEESRSDWDGECAKLRIPFIVNIQSRVYKEAMLLCLKSFILGNVELKGLDEAFASIRASILKSERGKLALHRFFSCM